MKPRAIDPEYERYRRKYPKFPGVTTCVDLIRRPNVKGAYLDGVMGDLMEQASTKAEELLAAIDAERDDRVRSLLLSVIAEAPSADAFPILVETLLGPDEDLRVWAARGLHVLDTPSSRKALWEARSKRFATPAETERFQEMLSVVERWK